MRHKFMDGVKYAVDVKLDNEEVVTDGKCKEEEETENKGVIKYKKEYNKEEMAQMVKDMTKQAKGIYHGELIIYQVSKTYKIIPDVYVKKTYEKEETDVGNGKKRTERVEKKENIDYLALRLVPEYRVVDRYKF